ncbi:very-long-chain acyl-synthetase family protein [Grosmannia clavigera kw1407]|uniref:Very-long-chain acyl-synthetase family protein n=1 Tax=Grosmannia clavigera (strain kw1407 / UAMH 11150) TaxID=655863 RepID=F0XR30_GROCL|nr:very-long-chain acyl-synthetase family protein [Grosmannia clavigera kw1407]EFW99870.1 very-long-chain acyl-synthetase family protein [Grosmannia clavigera kw1407]
MAVPSTGRRQSWQQWQRAREDPGYESIWSRTGCYTRKEVYDRANQYGQWFQAQGMQPGDLVALFMENSPDFMTAWIGLLSVGAAPAMINYHLTSQALLHCLAISSARLVLVDGPATIHERIDDAQDELAAAGYRVVKLADVRAGIYGQDVQRPGDELRADVAGDWPLGLFYTSGTTGLPKACFRSSWRTATGCPTRPMLAGTTLCVAPRFSVRGFWPDVRESRATWFVYVGETLRYLLAVPADEAADRCHAVHSIYGNGLRPDVWQRFRDRFGIQRIHEFFNSTEGVFALDNVCRGPFLRHAVGHHGALLRLRYHGLYVPVAVDSDTGDIVRDLATGFACRMPYHLGVSTAEVAQVLGNFPGILEANVYGVELPGHDGKAGAAAISIDPQQ